MARKTEPAYSRSLVNKAGDAVRERDPFVQAQGRIHLAGEIIENFRASHAYVLNTFQATLRNRCRNTNITFAQRLKRRPTIYNKLEREPEMNLARMHDIAGCRLIFSNLAELDEFQTQFRGARFKHTRRNADRELDPYDYISRPKPTGYRGRHDVFRYQATTQNASAWNGLNVEVQYRTQVQHAWATAVEIAGSITANRPKFNQGDDRYLDFFRLASEILARHQEGLFSCYPDYSNKELVERFRQTEDEIHLLIALENINRVNREFSINRNVILIFNEKMGGLTTESYRSAEVALARYFDLENESDNDVDVVLVRADNIESIMYAFRNYFSDSQEFVRLVKLGIEELT